jgi:hypothetical protein
MTEEQWWASEDDPHKMLHYLRGKASDRKLRLFAVACCRYLWCNLADERSRTAVEVAERFSDGLATERKLQDASSAARAAAQEAGKASPASDAADVAAWTACSGDGHSIAFHVFLSATEDAESKHQATLLRCIFGPRIFRPVTLDSSLLTLTVKQLAEAIYDDRAFDRLPILADALEDAGCDNADILNHCRQPGEHVRGCWVVDLILGKK